MVHHLPAMYVLVKCLLYDNQIGASVAILGRSCLSFQKNNRLAYLNFLRAKYESFSGEVKVESYPYYLMIDPSSVCQLKCPICPPGIENEARTQSLTVGSLSESA